jgi:4-hydroxy-L-threonine phosphate dehydrogenase PdxA
MQSMPRFDYPKHIFCTTGESAGIGTEITLCALAHILNDQAFFESDPCHFKIQFHVLGDKDSIVKILARFNLEHLKTHHQITWHFHNTIKSVKLGQLQLENSLHAVELLNLAVQKIAAISSLNQGGLQSIQSPLKIKKTVMNAALVTAPIHKKIINDGLQANIQMQPVLFEGEGERTFLPQKPDKFYGHTEYLAELANIYGLTDQLLPVLMLLNGFDYLKKRDLKVALATVHVPLRDVFARVIEKTKNGLGSGMAYDLQLISDALSRYFNEPCHLKAAPDQFNLDVDTHVNNKLAKKIKVSGLNPHAGENGLLGHEEALYIDPLIKMLKPLLEEDGVELSGCFSGDTIMMQDADCFYYMQHDQGLAPFKYVTFGQAANITLGLPFIRTSVDHGTALDLASLDHTKRPDYHSMHYAIIKAINMLKSQERYFLSTI